MLNFLKGGWSYTTFSNNEPSLRACAQGFSTAFHKKGKMRKKGDFLVNAKNSLIEAELFRGKKKQIEQANLAFICAHGSPNSINLEYHPTKRLLPYGPKYKWGEGGRLQWVFAMACDSLAYAVDSKGQIIPDADWPFGVDPGRWNEDFRGISGVLGFRSLASYVPSEPLYTQLLGLGFGRRLLEGYSFFDAWIDTQDFYHGSLGIQADVAIYCSSNSSGSDSLRNFTRNRVSGLDRSSIRHRLVGRGQKPNYSMQVNVLESRSRRKLFPTSDNENLIRQMLRSKFRNIEDSVASYLDHKAEKLHSLRMPLFEVGFEKFDECLSLNNPIFYEETSLNQRSTFAIKAKNLDFNENYNDYETTRISYVKENFVDGLSRYFSLISLNGMRYNVIGDYGIQARKLNDGYIIFCNSMIKVKQVFETLKVLDIGKTLIECMERYHLDGNKYHINGVTTCYKIDYSRETPILMPVLSIYVTIRNSGIEKSLVLFGRFE